MTIATMIIQSYAMHTVEPGLSLNSTSCMYIQFINTFKTLETHFDKKNSLNAKSHHCSLLLSQGS